MRRRILHIIATLRPRGAEKQLTLLACGLPRDEFDVHVTAITQGGPLADDLERAQIPVTVIGKRWKFDPTAWWRLRQHIVRLQPGPGADLDVHRQCLRSYGRDVGRSAADRGQRAMRR